MKPEGVVPNEKARSPLVCLQSEPIMNWNYFANKPLWGSFVAARCWELGPLLLRGAKTTLTVAELNALSSEKPGINGPNPRTQHQQGRAKGR